MDFGKFWEKYGLYVALLFMFVMMWTYTVPWLRTDVGRGIDGVFAPLVTEFGIPFFILIVILSALTGLVLIHYPEVHDRLRADDGSPGPDEGFPERVPRSHALPG